MSISQSHQLSISSSEEDADFRDLFAALVRRRRWLIASTALGLLLAAPLSLAAATKKAVQLLVLVNNSPKVLANAVVADPESASKDLAVLPLRPIQSPEEVRLTLQAMPAFTRQSGWRLGALKTSKAGEEDIITVSADVAPAEVQATTAVLDQLASAYKAEVLRLNNQQIFDPPRSDWTKIQPLSSEPRKPFSILLFGGAVGVAAGVAAALLADKRANRVFSAPQLLRLLPYPVLAKFPAEPWDSSSIQAELFQLAQQLDVELRWHVLSIAQPHPLVESLVAALRPYAQQIELEAGQPLLAHGLAAPAGVKGHGVLLVVEPGFNSAQALQEAVRVLALLPGLKAAGLVLAGQTLPPELRG